MRPESGLTTIDEAKAAIMPLKYRMGQNFTIPLGMLEQLRALSKRTRVPQSRYVEEALQDLLIKYDAARILEEDNNPVEKKPVFGPGSSGGGNEGNE